MLIITFPSEPCFGLNCAVVRQGLTADHSLSTYFNDDDDDDRDNDADDALEVFGMSPLGELARDKVLTVPV